MIKLFIKIFILLTVYKTFANADRWQSSLPAPVTRDLNSLNAKAKKTSSSEKETSSSEDPEIIEITTEEDEPIPYDTIPESDTNVYKVTEENKKEFEENAENIFNSFEFIEVDGVSSLDFKEKITIKNNVTFTVTGTDAKVTINCPIYIDDLFTIKEASHVEFSQIEIKDCDMINKHLFKITDQSSFTMTQSSLDRILSESGGVIKVSTKSVLILKNVTFSGNDNLSSGGALHIDKSILYMENCYFYKNQALNNGGAVELVSSRFTITKCEFIENKAGAQGGAIGVYDYSDGNVEVTEFKGNTAKDGAAIYSNECTVKLHDVVFEGNSAASRGGAVDAYMDNAFMLSKCSFYGNWAIKEGGDIRSQSSQFNITESIFEGSKSDSDGGCLDIKDGTVIVTKSTFKKCSSAKSGGAIFLSETTSVIESCSFIENSCVSQGGAVKSEKLGHLELFRSDFKSNKADRGGAVDVNSTVSYVDGITCFDNSVEGDGGCMYFSNAEVVVIKSDFYRNFAKSYGGDIAFKNIKFLIESSTFTKSIAGYAGGSFSSREDGDGIIKKCKFQNCTCDNRGGAIDLYNSTLAISSTSFVENKAESEGGAIRINNYARLFSLESSILDGNYAQKGSAIYTLRTNVTIFDCQFENHKSTKTGVLSLRIDSQAFIYDSLFYDNKCEDKGGIAFLEDQSTSVFVNCILSRNEAVKKGGVFYMNNECKFLAEKCSLIDNIAEYGCIGYVAGSTVQSFNISSSDITYNNEIYAEHCKEPIYIENQKLIEI